MKDPEGIRLPGKFFEGMPENIYELILEESSLKKSREESVTESQKEFLTDIQKNAGEILV